MLIFLAGYTYVCLPLAVGFVGILRANATARAVAP